VGLCGRRTCGLGGAWGSREEVFRATEWHIDEPLREDFQCPVHGIDELGVVCHGLSKELLKPVELETRGLELRVLLPEPRQVLALQVG